MKNLTAIILLVFALTVGCKKSHDQVIEKPVAIDDTTTIFTEQSSEWVITKSKLDTSALALNLYFINRTTGFVFGSKGTIFKTADSGKSWKKFTTGTTLTIFSVFFLDEKTGFAGALASNTCQEEDCGKGGLLLKTTDGGETWSKHFSTNVDGLLSITFLNEQTGLAINPVQGGNPHPIKTTDGGKTWEKINIRAQLNLLGSPLSAVDSTVYVLGELKSIFKSTDYGKNWTELPGSTTNLKNVQFLDKNNGFTYSKSSLYKTTDGGNTWQETSLPPSSDGFLIHFANTTTALGIEPVHTDHPMGLLPNFHGSYAHEIHSTNSGWNKSKLYPSLRMNLWHFPEPTIGYGINGNTFYTIKKK